MSSLWLVEKIQGIDRYALVKGYNEKRIVWKDLRGFHDFICNIDAKSKAHELNNMRYKK